MKRKRAGVLRWFWDFSFCLSGVILMKDPRRRYTSCPCVKLRGKGKQPGVFVGAFPFSLRPGTQRQLQCLGA